MHRRIVALSFAFLLLGMQQAGLWHALSHDADRLHRPQEQGLQLPQDDSACEMCALFAGGSTAVTGGTTAPPMPVASHAPAPQPDAPRAAVAPSFYLSRAPPVSA